MWSSLSAHILPKLSTYRAYFYFLPFGLIAVISYKEWEQELIVWPLGIGIILLGLSIRFWATKHIGRRMPGMTKKGKRLVRTGPYAIIRNPLYVGNIAVAVGLTALSELVWFSPFVFFYFFTLYHLVVIYEEKKLLARWGDEYRAYLNEVPRWMPQFKNVRCPESRGFDWRDTLRSEIPSFLVTLLGTIIFVAKELLSGWVG
jgi:protein-S-isoprenylcysteine O-methyltransferase Ste14